MYDLNYKSHVQRHKDLLRERENDRLAKQVLAPNRQVGDQKIRRLFNAFLQWVYGVMRRPAAKQTSAGVCNKEALREPGS